EPGVQAGRGHALCGLAQPEGQRGGGARGAGRAAAGGRGAGGGAAVGRREAPRGHEPAAAGRHGPGRGRGPGGGAAFGRGGRGRCRTVRVLAVTNGHGEDQLAVCVVDAVRERWPWFRIEAIPLVGEGARLRAAGIAVPGPRVRVPSGGMVRPQIRTVVRDLRAGLLGQFRRQLRFVASRRDHVDQIIAVGDVFAGWAAGRSLPGKPLVLVATAKSEYIHGHSRIETWWMRRRADHVFARDERTAAALRRAGVKASWAGNLMMDAMAVTGALTLPRTAGPVVAL